jgi:bile acid:Na+ symporter, BASS family
MNSALTTVLLPAVLGIIMFGLGLSLTAAELLSMRRNRRAIGVALVCQLVVLPVLCFGLVLLLGLSPILCVGMMLLAASPGGTSASLFSHLFRGDVALNIAVTAINSFLAVLTLPLVVNFSIGYFLSGGESIGLQFDKLTQVLAVVVLPVFLGMAVRNRAPAFAERMDKPVRIASVAVLLVIAVAAIISERNNIAGYLAAIGVAAAVFCLMSLTLGYVLPRLARVDHRQSIAVSMEIGVHNGALAITIAVTLLGSTEMAIPAAIYIILQPFLAAAVGTVIVRSLARSQRARPASG